MQPFLASAGFLIQVLSSFSFSKGFMNDNGSAVSVEIRNRCNYSVHE